MTPISHLTRFLPGFLLCLLCVQLAAFQAMAQDASTQNPADAPVLLPPHFQFSPDTPRHPDVPSPESFLGYAPGANYTFHADMLAYVRTLAASSDRVTMDVFGKTYEDRQLPVLWVTSAANHARLEEIRQANLRLTDPSTPTAERDAILAENPVIVWLSYNVHGNEASSTETAMQVAWHLASATDAGTGALLEDVVVIIVPSMNPDGRDRYVYWYRSVASKQLRLDAADLEHDEPWPGGRSNHYWFDLNRDWTWLVHPESRGRIEVYQQWLPQVHTDYHEQGFNANYFTMPGQAPRNLNLPDAYDNWADLFGRANAKAFDRAQVNYFTREAFDFFYPGYGSSYPSLFGAIGMLTEQGGHSRGGRAVETDDGYVLTLRQRIFDHYETSLATIEAAVENRRALLDYFVAFHDPARRTTRTSAYWLPDDDGNGYLYEVLNTLLKHGVTVERTTAAATVRDAHDYRTGTPSPRSFDAGTYVVRTDQADHIFIETLMQRRMEIEDSVMYDMSTWSVPLAYNLDAAWSESDVRVATERVAEAPGVAGRVEGGEAGYAYVIDWAQRHAPKALAALWRADYRVRSVTKPFTFEGTTWSRGSLVVLMGRNRERADRIHADMQRIAREAGDVIRAFNTGRMDEGIDLASGSARPVEEPKVALLVDEGVSSLTAGQLWFLFDQWTEFGIDRIRTGSFPSLDMTEYDVLLLAGGSYGAVLDSTQTERLSAWVRAGGTLVATESATTFAVSSGLVDAKWAPAPKADSSSGLKDRYYTPYEARSDSSGLRRVPGAAMLGKLDATHPLAFGVGESLYSIKFNADALVPSDRLQTVGWYAANPEEVLISGYASGENTRRIAGHAFAAVQTSGSGRVVLLVDNTQYRLFWVGPARLVQNAVMIMPGM